MKIKVKKNNQSLNPAGSESSDNGAVADRFKLDTGKGKASKKAKAPGAPNTVGVISTSIAFTVAIITLVAFSVVAFMLYDSWNVISKS